jgi:preprotein translocase subunit Sec61beta
MEQLEDATGAVLFVRINSDQNVEPLDWVTAAGLLRFEALQGAPEPEKRRIPTQVALCELVRFMEHRLGKSNPSIRPKLAVLVTAWDRLDADRAASGPTAYIEAEYPLLGGRLRDVRKFDVKVFGVSIVGGDFVDDAFKQGFFQKPLKACGYIVEETEAGIEKKADLTLPIEWAVRD